MHLAADVKEGVALHETFGAFSEHVARVQFIDLPAVFGRRPSLNRAVNQVHCIAQQFYEVLLPIAHCETRAGSLVGQRWLPLDACKAFVTRCPRYCGQAHMSYMDFFVQSSILRKMHDWHVNDLMNSK